MATPHSDRPATGAHVLIEPANGGAWIGEVVDKTALDDDSASSIEVPDGYALVRCLDQLNEPRLARGHVYLVLTRFLDTP